MSKSKKNLSDKFAFWYHINEISSEEEYESQIKKLAEFDTLEDFWAIFQYLKKPDDCKQAIEFQLFRHPIKPMWEDENNKNGGRISLKLRKEFSNLVWEELVFAFIGGYFAKEINDEINGLVINCKKDFNALQIWIKSYSNEITSAIEKNIREMLCIPKEVVLDIKPFNQPQKDYNNYNNYNNYNSYNNYNYNNYNNYNNYKGYNQKKNKNKNNNYYKKRGSNEAKEFRINESNKVVEDKKDVVNEEDKTKEEKEIKKEKENEKEKEKENEKEKEKEKEKENEKEKEKEKEREKEKENEQSTAEKKESNEEFTQVKRKKKKKKE